MTRNHICLVAHFAYGAMADGESGHIGGVERQTSLMARWFAAKGHRVSLLTWDEGQPDEMETDGVRIHKICRQRAGMWGLRFFHPRWTGLIRAMQAADADVYYQNCAEYVTGQVARWCRKHGRGFVYSVASDPDCDAALPELKHLRERVLYRYGLRHADSIIVQTAAQRDMLRSNFGLDSTVIPMPCPGPAEQDFRQPALPTDGPPHVLWLGRIAQVKRLDRLIEVAKLCPKVLFDVVGPVANDYDQAILRSAENAPNITLHGAAKRDQVGTFFRQAACLCCTSDYEGFPNTFLEAWSHGVPVVSPIDPDGLICAQGLGGVAEGAAGLASAIRSLFASPDTWGQASRNARDYYVRTHAVDSVMPQFERIFSESALARASVQSRSGDVA